MRNRKNSIQRGASTRDRIIARIMVLILTVSMMPYQALAADTANEKRVKSVEDIQTDYEASQEEIGLPSSLSVVIETGEGPERSEETVQEDILWEGEYDGDSVEAIFTNTLIPPPPNRTGDDAPLAVLGAVLAAGIAGLGVVLYRRRRR